MLRCKMMFVVLVTSSFLLAADDEAAKKDLVQLQGEWTMLSGCVNGVDLPEAMRPNFKRVCKDDVVTVTDGAQMFMSAKFTLDPSKSPKAIDYDLIDGPNKGKKQLGIYELDGDTLKACFAAPGGDRPTEFKSTPGDGRTLSSWKKSSVEREKKP